MPRVHLALCLVLVAAAAGCDALLGVEDVVLDDGRGGSGGGPGGADDPDDGSGGDATGSGDPTWDPGSLAAGGGGAGSPVAAGAGGGGASGSGGGSSTTAASAGSGGADPAGATSSSATGGGACVQDRPACPGVVPSRFEEGSALDAWLVESPRAKVAGKKLHLDPEEDGSAASVRSAAPVELSGPCAVWVRREDGHDGLTRLALLDDGGGERLAIAWSTSGAFAYADGVEVGSVGASDPAARLLRIRLDTDGAHLEIRSADTTCWEPVAGPLTVPRSDGAVRLSYAGDGKAKLDDYAVP